MWQVAKDTHDNNLDAKLYTDQWPHFTTVISQEFSPKLSEVVMAFFLHSLVFNHCYKASLIRARISLTHVQPAIILCTNVYSNM